MANRKNRKMNIEEEMDYFDVEAALAPSKKKKKGWGWAWGGWGKK